MLPNTNHIKYGSKSIEYNLSFTTRKTLGIKVMPDGNVKVIAPIGADIIDINQRVKSKAYWILKQQAFFGLYKPNTPKRKFVNGETHLYLGRQYKLQIVKADVDSVKIYRGSIVISAKEITPICLEKILNNWYKSKATILFDELLTTSLEVFKKYKIEKPALYIRQMEKRWGSCTKTGKIILNTQLIKAPKGSIEYVVIHELCHLVHRNHNKDFYALQNKLFPNWEKWKEKLEHALS
jgi:predicted metal-dependent hydrolase